MTKETKQDVFYEAMRALNGLHILDMEYTSSLNDRFKAATPCELPVIPAKLVPIMKWYKRERWLSVLLEDAHNGRVGGPKLSEWVAVNDETVALAWLLGEWEVEDAKNS